MMMMMMNEQQQHHHHHQQQQQHQQQQHEQSDEAVRAELLKTLEYYFSSKNLSKDEYLVSQMDEQSYVSIDEIAKFNKVRTLTSDKQFIRQIIAQSDQLELDTATGNKVRSVNGRLGGTYQPKAAQSASQQRSVLILREVSPEATSERIQSLFDNKEPLCPACEKCESAGNHSWYVTFTTEDQAQRALQYLKTEVQVFMDRAIKARIKAHAIPRSNTSGFVSLTPTSTPPPPPLPPPASQSIQPAQQAQPPAAMYQPPLLVQSAGYELPVYPPAATWPVPIQNALFLVDINQQFQELEHRAEANSPHCQLNQTPAKLNMMPPKQYGVPMGPYGANHHHYIAQPTPSAFYAPLYDDQKTPMPLQQPPPLNTPPTAPTVAYFYNQLSSAVSGIHQHQVQTSSTSSSSSSPRLSQQQQQHHQQQQQFRPRVAEVKVGPPAQTAGKYGKGKPSQHNHYQHEHEPTGSRGAPVFNSDSSFPPLNPTTRNITISLQSLPPRKLADEQSNDMTPNDPAIISCYKSADYIPDSPTIIKSNSVIDSTSQESKKATSETLANILNHEHKPDYKSPHYHHRNKHESYQPRNRNSRPQPQRKNDPARYVRSSHSSVYVDAADSKRRAHKEAALATESCAANDDDALGACWSKKLTFAEIVQKSASTSPSPIKSANDADSIAAEFSSPQSIAAE